MNNSSNQLLTTVVKADIYRIRVINDCLHTNGVRKVFVIQSNGVSTIKSIEKT